MSSAAEMLEDHREMIEDEGESIIIRRYPDGDGDPIECRVAARVLGYAPGQLVGSIIQGDRRIIALNDPDAVVTDGMVALADLLPLDTNDKAVVRGRELAVKAIDDNTRRVGGTLIALEIQAGG